MIAPWTVRNLRVHDRFVLIASEGGVTFWTGNHPLARGEGDLAANPDLKRAELAFRHSASRAHAPKRSSRSTIGDALALDRANTRLAWARSCARKAFYTRRPDRAVVCATLRRDIVSRRSCRICSCCRSPLAGARRAVAQPRRPGGAVAAGRVVGSRGPRLLSAGAVPDSGDRSRADRLRRRAGRPSAIVNTPPTRPRRRSDLQRARQPAAARRAACSRTTASACWSSTTDRRTAPARSPTRWRASMPGRIEVMHRTGPRGLGRSYIDGLQQGDRAARRRSDLPDGRRPLAQPRVPAGARRGRGRPRRRHRVALPERRQRRELAAAPNLPQRLRQPLHPRRDAA